MAFIAIRDESHRTKSFFIFGPAFQTWCMFATPLRWFNPSIAQGVMARSAIPVTVFARGHAGVLERYGVPAGAIGLAALLLSGE